MKLTAAKIRAAEARDRSYKLADGGGLFLYVAPTGLRSLRMSFRFGGKAQLLVFGSFPEISLQEARDRRDDARQQLRQGVNPAGARRRALEAAAIAQRASSFEAVARAWHAAQLARWSTVHAGDVLDSLERLAFPRLGARALADIDAPAVLGMLRSIEASGSIETARRLRQRLAKIFAFAIAEGIASSNPAAIVAGALLPPAEVEHQPAIVDIDGARAAFAAIAAAPADAPTRLAAEFLALTAARSAAVRGARWDEIKDLEPRWGIRLGEPFLMNRPTWTIPATRMKLKRARKGNAAFDHPVPLSAAAVDVLRRARAIAGDGALVFPRAPGGAEPIGINALSDLHARAGLRGRHTPHGWRASFSTIMNERDAGDRAAIDMALAHSAKGKVEAAYNRAQLLGRRREIFDAWASIITAAPSAPATPVSATTADRGAPTG